MAEYFDNSLTGRLKWLYLQWELLTSIYMLEPWERKLFNFIAICIAFSCAYIGFVMMPRIYGILTG